MKGSIKHIDGFKFKCIANNKEIILDDGTSSMSPMHAILVSIATCTSMDVLHILEKKRLNVDDFKVNVEGKRNETYPKIFNTISLEYIFWGDLEETACDDAIRLSLEKYCSISNMLKDTIEINTSIKIIK